MTRLLSAVALTLWLAALPGCVADRTLRWTEDVQLPDGRVVTLKRIQSFDEQGFVDAHSFEFEHPVTKEMIRWHSDVALYAPELPQPAARQKRPTTGFFRLVALFMVNDVPHILVSPTFGGQNEQAGCPYPSMFIYKHVGGGWQQVPYAQSPVREVTNNTTMDPKYDREHIKASNFKIAAGGVRVLSHPVDQHNYGINLNKLPVQVFHCPAQKRFALQ